MVADVLAEILAELRAIRQGIDRLSLPGQADVDPRVVAVVRALADVLPADPELPFEAAEVLVWAKDSEALAAALTAAGLLDAEDVGLMFRGLKGRTVAGLRVVRDRRTWCLVPVARTSCT